MEILLLTQNWNLIFSLSAKDADEGQILEITKKFCHILNSTSIVQYDSIFQFENDFPCFVSILNLT